MFVEIDLQCDIPIYKQLKTAIIHNILNGNLKEGDRLPSVRQLGCDLGINLNTVSRVYTLLKDAGYIQIRHGRGAIINAVPTMHECAENYAEALFPYIIEMRSQGITKAQVEELIDDLWEQSIKGGKEDE